MPRDLAAYAAWDQGPARLGASRRAVRANAGYRGLHGTDDLGKPPPDKIRVFLLDDHEVVRRGLASCSSSEGDIEVVGESGLAQEATRRIPALRPDVAVLDGRLPTARASTSAARSARAIPRSPR